MTLDEYFINFFEEKEVPFKSWKIIDDKGTYHYISTEVVIEAIQKVSTEMKEQIRTKLVEIDFNNAPILPFLQYIAKWLINNHNSLGGN